MFAAINVFGQTKTIDSIRVHIEHAQNNEEKIHAVFLICEERQSMNSDTLYHYAVMAKRLAQTLNNPIYSDLAEAEFAFYLAKKELIDSSLDIVGQLLRKYENDPRQKEIYKKLSLLKVRVLSRGLRYVEMNQEFFKQLSRAEQDGDTLGQIITLNGIGYLRLEMGQYRESVNWLNKALNIPYDIEQLKRYSALYSNTAKAYYSLRMYDSATYFINRAIRYGRETGTLTFLATSLSYQADILMSTKHDKEAEASLHEAIELRKQIGDPFYVLPDMTQLALFYAHRNQPEKGIALCEEGIQIAKKNHLEVKLPELYHALAENYKEGGDSSKYAETLERIITLKDSLYDINSDEILAELQMKYDVQKKENLIIHQQYDIDRKNYLLYGSIVFLLIATTGAYFIFKEYKKRQRLKMSQMQFEEKRLGVTAVKEAEENERKRIAADLHDNLGVYAASITSNLDQISVKTMDEPGKIAMKELKNNSQSIVSQLSDTIWALKKDALLLTAISDRLKVFAQQLQPSYPGVTIDIIEHISIDHLLPPSQAFHLFRITQEAISNALRHSQCHAIKIEIDSDADWKISITDDGKGLTEKEAKAQEGNGLANMRARAQECGWHIEWKEKLPSGTSVEIRNTTN